MPRPLINEDGTPFKHDELMAIKDGLRALDSKDREDYRNKNAETISNHSNAKSLIVSGPGTGKTYLFLSRINCWHEQDSSASVLVTTFVRKLVADLQTEIGQTDRLTDNQKENITVSTLHRLARSIVEENHGTREWKFKAHFRIIGPIWEDIVWQDVLAFCDEAELDDYPLKDFKTQLHLAEFKEEGKWPLVKSTYFELCKFYNAAGFDDLILRAFTALEENPHLVASSYFIVDEYQDFNPSENQLVSKLVGDPKGLLYVGDDDQVLYEFRSGNPDLIRGVYSNDMYLNAMLPFCGRSSTHITLGAAGFINRDRPDESIEKIFLPINADDGKSKIQVVGTTTVQAAVDYIQKFIEDHQDEIDRRKEMLENGQEKEAYLMILSPIRDMDFYGKHKDDLLKKIDEYLPESRKYSEEYFKLLNYYSLAGFPENNFTFRKVLWFEGAPEDEVHALVEHALERGVNLCEIDSPITQQVLEKCRKVKGIVDNSNLSASDMAKAIGEFMEIENTSLLEKELTDLADEEDLPGRIDHEEEEEAERDLIEIRQMGAIEQLTFVGAKGLSADHVIIVGFDETNMERVTRNAFYVALTRARESLHIISARQARGSRWPHIYLKDIPSESIDFHKYTKGKGLEQFEGISGFVSYFKKVDYAVSQSKQAS